jgi:hypothetical protein
VQRWLCFVLFCCFVVMWTLFSFPIYLGKVDGHQVGSCADGDFFEKSS